jgi:hypothetical protein
VISYDAAKAHKAAGYGYTVPVDLALPAFASSWSSGITTQGAGEQATETRFMHRRLDALELDGVE